MPNNNFNYKLSYFSTPRKHDNVFAWNKPVSKSERSNQVTDNILRWEDDGGPVTETRTSLGQVAQINTARRR
jgi:hypothetical protein